MINKWVLPYWATMKLTRISRADVVTWIEWMEGQGATAWTIDKAYRQLQASMTYAIDKGKRNDTPCHHIELPKPTKGAGMAFTEDEIQAILECLAPPYDRAITALPYMGLRFGEMAGLHWADIHGDMAWVSHTWDRHGRFLKPYPKSGPDSCRWVPIPNPVLEVLGDRPDFWQEPCGLEHAENDPCPGSSSSPRRAAVRSTRTT